MISMHTSPLATPGVGDAGGLNVYVAELARRLGERGLKVDVFTRRDSPDLPDIVEIHEHTRVIHLTAGPVAYVAKEALPSLTEEFCAALEARLDDHDLIHTHYWLSGLVGAQLKARHGIPLVHTMHTMARVKNSNLGEDQLLEPHVRERGESAIVRAADVLTASTSDEAAELQGQYCAQAGQIMIVPPGVDLHTFHPCDQPKSRAQFGVAQDIQVILFVGRIQPLKAPDVLIKAVAELARRDPGRHDRLQLIIIGGPAAATGNGRKRSARWQSITVSRTWSTSAHTRPARNSSAGTASLTSSRCRPTTSPSDSWRSRRKRADDQLSQPTSEDSGTRFVITTAVCS